MSIGFVMLCHTALDRAAAVARHWSEQGCPVVIHVDRRVAAGPVQELQRCLGGLDNVRFATRHPCEWGTWGLVAATQTAAELMLRCFPQVRHVYLASGACLPLRSVGDLQAYVDDRPRTDFIESVTIEDVGWTVGGLDLERFTLRFPFSWRKQRHLFDAYVDLQRRVGLRRRIPQGLAPHMGSQWWCLTRQTLSAILDSPDRKRHDGFFRRVWIPDESYFQTLVRRYATQIESRSLTLSKFDFQGKPHIFYDDHLQLLRRSDCFVARKIWPCADRLYASFLAKDGATATMAEPNTAKIDRVFSRAVERRTKGRPGLYMQSRFPNENWENGKTCSPYSVFQGFTDLFENFETWLQRLPNMRVHGHLYAPDRAQFAQGAAIAPGALTDSARLRDYNPHAFLTNLIWNTRGERQCFQFGPADRQDIAGFIASDANAQVSVISGAWAVRLYQSNRDFGAIRREAALLQKIEQAHIATLRAGWAKARVRIWTLAEFVDNPMGPLQAIMEEIAPRTTARLTEVPRLTDLTGFGQFLQALRNQGMQPVLVGDFPTGRAALSESEHRSRPYLVK